MDDNLEDLIVWIGEWGIIIITLLIIIAIVLILAGQAQISFN